MSKKNLFVTRKKAFDLRTKTITSATYTIRVGTVANDLVVDAVLNVATAPCAVALPDGVYLTGFDFAIPAIKGKEKPRIAINGFSPDRETLLIFQSNLKNEKRFSEIYFSPESWIEPENVKFNVTFRFNNKIK